jgi:competence protein ComEA
MPRAFSWEQLGVVVLLGAVLLGLFAWREHPSASPPVRLPAPVFVEVAGEGAAHPGVYVFEEPPPLLAVLEKAGVPSLAVPDNPVLASGTRVELSGEGTYQLSRMAGGRLVTLGLPLDLNSATAPDLERLPGLGPELARRIVAYRQEHGPFTILDDLTQVKGIGPAKLAHLKPYLSLAPPGQWEGSRSDRR